MDDYVVDYEMPLHVTQRWKTSKSPKEALKFQL